MTVVAAPAGFGKTTLLAGFVASVDARVGWIGLDVDDNDPAVFASYLAAALRAVGSGGHPGVGQPDPASSLEMVVVGALNELVDADEPVVLVLDDYQLIDSAEVHAAVELLVDRAPPSFRLVVASRADPPLPLARWRARGDLVEIRAADLRFTVDEATEYLNEAMRLGLSGRDVGALEARTEGWIAALQLAALSLQGRDDPSAFIETFAGDDRFVVDFLAEEVLDRQPDRVRSFLLQTSVLARLSGPLCDAVTASTGGRSMLEELERANMFVVPLDDSRRWYRYHHLFADVLRARLIDERPDMVGELHFRASAWFEQQDDPFTAIEHALAGEHFDTAARLIELCSQTVRAARQEATLRRWLEALPDSVFDTRPVLTLALVGSRMATGDSSGVASLLDRVERWVSVDGSGHVDDGPGVGPIVFDRVEFARLPAQLAVYRAALALLAGDVDHTIHHASVALELAAPDDHLRRGAAAALLGLACWRRGDLEMAERHYVESVSTFIAAGFVPDVLGCSIALADIQLALGRIGDAERTFRAALELAADRPGLRGTADMHVGLGEVHLERAQLGLAADELRISTELGPQAGLPQHPYRSRVAAARLHQAHGRFDEALDLLDEAAGVYDTDFSPKVQPIGAVRARVLLAAGNVDAARRWATSRGLSTDDALSYVEEFEHLTLARILVADLSTRADPATSDFVDRLTTTARLGGRMRSVIELMTLQALVTEARGDRPSAAGLLDQALLLAEPGGYIRLFTEAGPTITRLLDQVPLTPEARRRAVRVVADSEAATLGQTPRRSALVEALSDRELDVLRLLRSELTGPEIARELHISLNTFRTHTKNIYTKLGATNRREAVRLAADHGL